MSAHWTSLKQNLIDIVGETLGPAEVRPLGIDSSVGQQDTPVRRRRQAAGEQRPKRLGMTTQTFVLSLLAITVLAGGMRWLNIAGPSLWIDELFQIRSTVQLAEGDLHARSFAYVPSLLGLWAAGIDPTHLGDEQYAQWRAAGVTEQLIRVPMVIIGTLSIPILAWMSRRMIGTRAALILALLLAMSTWHLWMSQTARFYPQQFLFYNMCLLLYYNATRNGSRKTMIGAAVCLVLAFATQLTSLLILGIFAADWLLAWWRRERIQLGWSGVGIIAAAVGVCALMLGIHVARDTAAYTQFEGSHQSAKALVLGVPFMIGVATASVTVLSALWLWQIKPRLTSYLALAALVPLATFVVLALADQDVHIRYTYVGLFAWLALAAAGLDRLWVSARPHLGIAMAAAPLVIVLSASALSAYAYYTGGEGFRSRWREAFAYVAANRAEGEPVVADYIPHKLAQYYLETDDVRLVRARMSQSDIERAGQRPLWIVVRAESPTMLGRAESWLDKEAQLRSYFATRVLQPYSSVHVYYVPAERADKEALAPGQP